jgi:hypothetical protein
MRKLLLAGLLVAGVAGAVTVTVDNVTCATAPNGDVLCQPSVPPPPPPPPPPGLENCTKQGYSILSGAPIVIPWGPTGTTYFSSTSGNFANAQVWLFSVKPTAVTANYGRMVVSEYGGNAFARESTVSTTPCDFRWPPDVTGATGPVLGGNGTTASIYYGAGNAPVVYPNVLIPGLTYYLSIRNWALTSNTASCSQVTCQAILNVTGAK